MLDELRARVLGAVAGVSAFTSNTATTAVFLPVVTGLARRAKYGLIHTDRERTMVFHLGMSGRWRVDPSEPDKHDHLLIETGSGRVAALNDPAVKPKLLEVGFEIVGNTPAEFSAFQAAESARWKKLIETRKITAD